MSNPYRGDVGKTERQTAKPRDTWADPSNMGGLPREFCAIWAKYTVTHRAKVSRPCAIIEAPQSVAPAFGRALICMVVVNGDEPSGQE